MLGHSACCAVLLLAAINMAPVAAAAPASPTPECRTVGYVGDSLSDDSGIGRGSREQIVDGLSQIARLNGVRVRFSASSGRAVIPEGATTGAGSGTDAADGSGVEVMRSMKHLGGVDCWVVALGTNDAMLSQGNRHAIRQAIRSALREAGRDPVVWVTPQTRWVGLPASFGPSDTNMAIFRTELYRAAAVHTNLRVARWDLTDKSGPAFWLIDGIHLAAGRPMFAAFVLAATRTLVADS